MRLQYVHVRTFFLHSSSRACSWPMTALDDLTARIRHNRGSPRCLSPAFARSPLDWSFRQSSRTAARPRGVGLPRRRAWDQTQHRGRPSAHRDGAGSGLEEGERALNRHRVSAHLRAAPFFLLVHGAAASCSSGIPSIRYISPRGDDPVVSRGTARR